MNKINEAIKVLRKLPDEQQQTVARAILDYAAEDHVYHLTDYERGEVRAGLAEIERGEIATDADVRTVYRRIGI